MRNRTIDIFRALTMFFMIFVNDLWTLTNVPKWLEHTLAEEDGMGFSDVIFPLFLFIVGLSLPLAIENRLKKGESYSKVLYHISLRTFALLVMGFYMVNSEILYQEATAIDKSIWRILMASAIFLVWIDYDRLSNWPRNLKWGLQALGITILAYLAWVYRGGSAEDINIMQPRWWGILGLIGWAYLLNVIVYMISRDRIIILVISFLFLLFMNIQEKGFFEFIPSFRLVVGASNHVLVMGGVLCTVLFMKFKERERINQFLMISGAAGVLFITYGFLIRPTFPISKIYATPSWTAICMGIGLLSFVILYLTVDKGGYDKWARVIKSAGTSTLTCYLIPYFVYPIFTLTDFQLPELLTDGYPGLVKSVLFSLLVILFVEMLEKINIQLKI